MSENGFLIENTLSLDDLFSFDVVDNKIRANLETLFHTYERNIETYTLTLLKKLRLKNNDLNEEITNIFACKYLNFFRNPNCIEKVINTIGVLAEYEFTDPQFFDICKRIETGRKRQQEYLCAQLGITNEMYHKWLKILFMLLGRPKLLERNLLEKNIKSLFENTSHDVQVIIFNYTGEHSTKGVLLSDRGFSSPIEKDGCIAFSFNLCTNAFIYYLFSESPKWRINLLKKTNLKHIAVKYIENDLEHLASYNKNTLYQAKEKVYCSRRFVYGLEH